MTRPNPYRTLNRERAVLESWEKDMEVYRAIYRAAEAGERCPKADNLAEIIGLADGGAISTTVLVMHRLERQGLIQVRRYQREREVMIVETGKWTAPARCRTPHWRQMPVERRGTARQTPIAVKS